MAISPLMQILVECENLLGWVPDQTGRESAKARSVMHRVMTNACNSANISHEDLRLALNYCKRRRLPVDSPLQLLALVPKARQLAVAVQTTSSLLEHAGDALSWEYIHADDDSPFWVGRITRARGDGLLETLNEWQLAGRGA